MGVTVVEAKTPLTRRGQGGVEAARAPARRPSATTSTDDAAPFDSVPGAGFDSSPLAAAIVPPAGKITGIGPAHRHRSRAEQCLPRRERGVEGGRQGPRRRRAAAGSSITGLPDARRAAAGRIAGVAGREDRRGRHRAAAAARRAVPAVERQHGRRLDAVAARELRLRVQRRAPRPTSRPARCASASTC